MTFSENRLPKSDHRKRGHQDAPEENQESRRRKNSCHTNQSTTRTTCLRSTHKIPALQSTFLTWLTFLHWASDNSSWWVLLTWDRHTLLRESCRRYPRCRKLWPCSCIHQAPIDRGSVCSVVEDDRLQTLRRFDQRPGRIISCVFPAPTTTHVSHFVEKTQQQQTSSPHPSA